MELWISRLFRNPVYLAGSHVRWPKGVFNAISVPEVFETFRSLNDTMRRQGVAAGSILTVERFNTILKGMEETMYVIACSLGRRSYRTTAGGRACVRDRQTWTDGRRIDADGWTDARACAHSHPCNPFQGPC